MAVLCEQVHEHGKAGLDERALAELASKREKIAREHESTRDETTTQTNARPEVEVLKR